MMFQKICKTYKSIYQNIISKIPMETHWDLCSRSKVHFYLSSLFYTISFNAQLNLLNLILSGFIARCLPIRFIHKYYRTVPVRFFCNITSAMYKSWWQPDHTLSPCCQILEVRDFVKCFSYLKWINKKK